MLQDTFLRIKIEKIELSPIEILEILYRGIREIEIKILSNASNLVALYDSATEIEQYLKDLDNIIEIINENSTDTSSEAWLSSCNRIICRGRIERKKIQQGIKLISSVIKQMIDNKEKMIWHYNLFSGIYINWDEYQNLPKVIPHTIVQKKYLEI